MPKTFSMTAQQGNVTLILYPVGAVSSTQIGIPTGVGGNTLTLPITPEDMQISRPSRQAITQTLTSVYQDHLGSGVTTVGLRGHTGWRNLTADGDGYAVIKKLRDLLGNFDKAVAQGNPDSVWLLLLLNLPSGWEQFRVSKNTVAFSRSRAQPLLYRYEVQFTVLRDFNNATSQVDPSPNFVIQQGIFAPIKLDSLPSDLPGETGPTGSGVDRSGVTNSADQRASVINWKLLKKNVSDQELQQIVANQTVTIGGHKIALGEEEPGLYATGSVPPAGQTLLQFANDQYDINQFPGAMWGYIVAANPDIFRGNVDPATFVLQPGTALIVPKISPDDAFSLRYPPSDIASVAGAFLVSKKSSLIAGQTVAFGDTPGFPVSLTVVTSNQSPSWDEVDANAMTSPLGGEI